MGGVGLFIVIILSISLRSWWGLTVLQCWGEGQFLLGPVTGTAVLGRAVRYHTGTEPHYSEPSQNTMVKHQSTCPWWYKSKPSNRGRGSCYITCMLISQVSQCFKKIEWWEMTRVCLRLIQGHVNKICDILMYTQKWLNYTVSASDHHGFNWITFCGGGRNMTTEHYLPVSLHMKPNDLSKKHF